MRRAETKCTVTYMLRQYLRCTAKSTGAWYLQGEEATGHAAGDRPLACTRPHERRPRECVRQGGAGRTGALRGVRRHSRDHHATRHMYQHFPRYAAPRAHPTRAMGGCCTDATTGGARPTREDALRWVHDNAMGDGSCALWRRRSRVTMSCALHCIHPELPRAKRNFHPL
jgi:hypothetical protein